jgi:phytoene dehydrogenase-like protein
VLEKASGLGGRAATREKGGYFVNLGAHALYLGGEAKRVLDDLGVEAPGRTPPTSGCFAVLDGQLYTLPTGLLSLLTTGAVDLPGKVELARVLAGMGHVDAAALDRVTVHQWLSDSIRSASAYQVLATLFRVSTYTADLEHLSAGAAVRQLRIALASNVRYVDGGWQTLVGGLRRVAEAAGAAFRTEAHATSVQIADGAVRSVALADGSTIGASGVVLAVSPAAAAALVPGVPALAAHAARAVPVRAACLDLCLSRLPLPGRLLALGLDRPLYLSVHSASARLAPEGAAVVHLATYLTGSEVDGDPEAELSALMERVQPGYREVLVERRFLPSMVVHQALATAADGGLAGRPGVEVPGVRGLTLAGDWVGAEGMLADAALASARGAAAALSGEAAPIRRAAA